MEGTTRERSPGRWELRAFVGRYPVTGRPRQVTRTYGADRREPGDEKREVAKRMTRILLEGSWPKEDKSIPAGPNVARAIIPGAGARTLLERVWIPPRKPKGSAIRTTCKEMAGLVGRRAPAR